MRGHQGLGEFFDAAVQLIDAGNGADLRHLRSDLRVIQRIERILIAHLRNQQPEKAVLLLGRADAPGSRRSRRATSRCRR